jgi:16S rRNA (cytidine1402-2'-O)-methyltransferase
MDKQRGRLYLIPTPVIENGLHTLSPEVIRVIHSLDYFIVERARTSRRLVSVSKPPVPLDQMTFEEMPEDVTDEVQILKMLEPLKGGINVGLMSEAGLPAIADPGHLFVMKAQEMQIQVVPLAGPSSIMMALMASGLEGQRFSFHGYLSAKKQELRSQLIELVRRAEKDKATQIFIETPYRNHQIMQAVEEHIQATRLFCIAAGMVNEDGFVITKKVGEWKKSGWPEIHKVPAVFLIG